MGSKTSTTKQENSPPKWATPLFEKSASEAMNLYDSGIGGRTYLGNTVAPLSDTTMQGVNQLAQAGQGWDTAGTRGLYGQIGAGAVSNPYINKLEGVAGGVTGGQTDVSGINATNVSDTDFRGILNRAQGPSSAETNLQGYASGANLSGEGNPFYRQRMEGDLADAAAQVRSSMSGMGRGGGGAETRALTDRLGQMRLEGLENDWNREQANQFNAVGMIDAARNAGINSQLGAASGIAGIGTGNADRSLQAGVSRAGFDAADLDRALSAAGLQGNLLSNAGNMYSTGIGQAQDATDSMAGLDQQNFENRLAGAGATLQAGGMMDQQAQKQIADNVAKWYGVDNEDWTRLSMLQGAAAGAAGPYGSQLATSRQPVGIGGVMSGIGSMFSGKSDVRLKENVILVGAMNDLPVYEFSYRGQPDRWRGTMAQAIPLHRSSAVVMEDDGFYAVDYGKIGFAMERVR